MMGIPYLTSVWWRDRGELELLNGDVSMGCLKCDKVDVRLETYGPYDATYLSVRYTVTGYMKGTAIVGLHVDRHREERSG